MSENNREEIRKRSANDRRDLAQRSMVNLDEVIRRKKAKLAAAAAAAAADGQVPAQQPKPTSRLDKSAILSKLWKKRFPQGLIDEYLTANASHKLEDLLDMEPGKVQELLHRPRGRF